ncbi:hypothetical protein ACGCUQ_06515 [Eubacteriales bacterium KG127]
MTDFSQFKTCEKYGIFNRNTPNDADIVKTFSVWKSTDFYSSRAILPFYPNVVPAPAFQRRFLARSHKESLGGVSHSDGHSVVKYKRLNLPLNK